MYYTFILHDKKSFEKGLITGMILIDLQKTFDTIDHYMLLQSLYATGFSEYSVSWFQLLTLFSQPTFASIGAW